MKRPKERIATGLTLLQLDSLSMELFMIIGHAMFCPIKSSIIRLHCSETRETLFLHRGNNLISHH